MTDCDTITAEQVYLGHDNAVSIIPYSDYQNRVNYDMTNATLVAASADLVTSVASGDDVTADSDDVPEVIWWNVDASGIWQIHLKIGLFTGIVAGEYKIRVIITDPSHPNGLVIADGLLVDVVAAP